MTVAQGGLRADIGRACGRVNSLVSVADGFESFAHSLVAKLVQEIA